MSSAKLFLAMLAVMTVAGCGGFDRSDEAAAAKTQMIGMSREEVLACMGPPKKKASEGATEVWSYLSTDAHGNRLGNGFTSGGYTISSGEHDRNFCTVNVVMHDGTVKAVHYNGPTSSSLFLTDDECAYAVKNCVTR